MARTQRRWLGLAAVVAADRATKFAIERSLRKATACVVPGFAAWCSRNTGTAFRFLLIRCAMVFRALPIGRRGRFFLVVDWPQSPWLARHRAACEVQPEPAYLFTTRHGFCRIARTIFIGLR
jgi:hypothetical protein